MGLVRCDEHGKPSKGTNDYVMCVTPLGYPNTAAVCGIKGCDKVGRLWLNAEEAHAYVSLNERVFASRTSTVAGPNQSKPKLRVT